MKFRPRRKSRYHNQLRRLPQCNDDLMPALYEAFMMARRGKLNTNDEYRFETHYLENIEQLSSDIVTRRYKPGRSKAFIVNDPVVREIFAAPFKDRIVHHLLYAVVAPWWDNHFIYTASSCRTGKGTDFAICELQTAMRKASRNGTRKAYVFKGDISGYFMSMKRELLYEKVMWGLNKQFPEKGWLYDMCAYLWKEVIFDDPTVGVRFAGPKSDWEPLPKNKSLFNQPKGQGIVIGNLTSQLLSNIMMNEFDWYMKRKMGFKYYGRYVDDFYVVVDENEYDRARVVMWTDVAERLKGLGLKMHPKKHYEQETHKGCPFLGKVVRSGYILPGKRYKKNARRAFYFCATTGEKEEAVISYVGMSKNMQAKKFLDREFSKVGWRYRY